MVRPLTGKPRAWHREGTTEWAGDAAGIPAAAALTVTPDVAPASNASSWDSANIA